MAAMDDVPKELLKAAYQRKPIYLLKIPFGFGVIAACLWVLLRIQSEPYFIPAGIAISILVANCIRGLGAIAHDAVHGTTTRSKLANYFISLVCWAPTGMSVTIYGNYHLHHHRIANTYPDVDNFVVTDYTRNPFFAKVLLLGVYTFFYPVYFMFNMFRYVKRLTPWQRIRMNLELAGFWTLVVLAGRALPTMVFFFFFGLPFILGAFLASVTSMIEHFEMPPGEDAYGSRTYSTKSHLTNFIWNNVSYHNEHHKFPGIPWYNLRSFHEAALPYYDELVKAEVYPNMWGLAFRLWNRCLHVDVAKLEEKYRGINKKAEKEQAITIAGIQPEAA